MVTKRLLWNMHISKCKKKKKKEKKIVIRGELPSRLIMSDCINKWIFSFISALVLQLAALIFEINIFKSGCALLARFHLRFKTEKESREWIRSTIICCYFMLVGTWPRLRCERASLLHWLGPCPSRQVYTQPLLSAALFVCPLHSNCGLFFLKHWYLSSSSPD